MFVAVCQQTLPADASWLSGPCSRAHTSSNQAKAHTIVLKVASIAPSCRQNLSVTIHYRFLSVLALDVLQLSLVLAKAALLLHHSASIGKRQQVDIGKASSCFTPFSPSPCPISPQSMAIREGPEDDVPEGPLWPPNTHLSLFDCFNPPVLMCVVPVCRPPGRPLSLWQPCCPPSCGA